MTEEPWEYVKDVCVWKPTETSRKKNWVGTVYETWETSCGGHIQIIGTPEDNNMKFCPLCGRMVFVPMTG